MSRKSTVVFRESSRIPRAPAGQLAHEKEEFASWKDCEISGGDLGFHACAKRGIDDNDRADASGAKQGADPHPAHPAGRRRTSRGSRTSPDAKVYDWTHPDGRVVRTGIQGLARGVRHGEAAADPSRSPLAIRALGSVSRTATRLQ